MMLLKLVAPLAAAAVLAGCAASSPSAPERELAAAELAVRQVEESDASDYAPADVLQAQNKLEAANRAMEREDYVEARRMAEQALVDARLADVRVDAARSGEILAESEQSLEALESEALELSQ